MDDFEMAKYIRRWQALAAAEAINYKNWDDKYARENLAGESSLGGWKKHVQPVDVTMLSAVECDDLEFGLWSDDLPIRLIPLWLYQYLANGQELTSINGEKKIVADGYKVSGNTDYIDNDHRFGCIAWGFVPTA